MVHCAFMLKLLTIIAVSLVVIQVPVSMQGQTGIQQPHISVANPTPAQAQMAEAWPLHERIAWGANTLLAVLGYIGIMVAITTLKKIEHQSRSGETTAQAAVDAANAALSCAQALIRAERPWLLITVERSLTVRDSFKVTATNRGRTPAKILATSSRIEIVMDETQLPKNPVYEKTAADSLPAPIILLPGESTPIQPFSREDVSWICKTDASLRRIELWQEKIFIHGKIIYRDLVTPNDKLMHETSWCCWYVHGENSSDLVIAGPPEYNRHL